ncbi:hypothetical protein ZWY2020_055693 [Hordeum vulgare]|nr:hypothetical protein ZWY2020_055693 [Hordeum vulgare]
MWAPAGSGGRRRRHVEVIGAVAVPSVVRVFGVAAADLATEPIEAVLTLPVLEDAVDAATRDLRSAVVPCLDVLRARPSGGGTAAWRKRGGKRGGLEGAEMHKAIAVVLLLVRL